MSDIEELADQLADWREHCECTPKTMAHEGCNGFTCFAQRRAILSALQNRTAPTRLMDALEDARAAIASLPMEALGYASAENNQVHWPIRDELLHRIDRALATGKPEGAA